MIFGFVRKKEFERADIPVWEKLQKCFDSIDRRNNLWIYKYFEGYTNWNDKNVIKDLLDENSKTLADFASMIDNAVECAKDLEL